MVSTIGTIEPEAKASSGLVLHTAADMNAGRAQETTKGVLHLPQNTGWGQGNGSAAGSWQPTSRKFFADEEFPAPPCASIVEDTGNVEKAAQLALTDVPLVYRSLNILVVCPRHGHDVQDALTVLRMEGVILDCA